MEFLNKPNLPDGKTSLCAIAAGFAEIKAALEAYGISVLEVQPHKRLAVPVSAHADMQLHDVGGGRLVAAGGADILIKRLRGLGFTVNEQDLAPEYPRDIALNCFMLGDNVYCNPKGISKILFNYYQSIEKKIIPVKQGYAKCSTCIVDGDTIITADGSIAEAAGLRGVGVLRIQSGYISLPGYDSGFIGGASGLIDKKRLAFTGRLSNHPDGERIKAFCASRGVSAVELTDSVLVDIGGILPLAI